MNKRIILVVGALAAIVAIIWLVVMQPEPNKTNPYVAQLEQEMGNYTAQIDSMDGVIDTFSNRINAVRAQLDSSRASNRILVVSLQKVTSEMKEYRRLYGEQRALNKKLQDQLIQAQSENVALTSSLQGLREQMAQKDEELIDREVRIKRLEASLEDSQQREQEAVEAISQVFVYSGTRKNLEEAGFLQVRQKTIFTDEYKRIGFPDEMSDQVVKVNIGSSTIVQGNIHLLADRHGKLKEGREFDLKKEAESTQIIFKEPTLEGQRVLVVLK